MSEQISWIEHLRLLPYQEYLQTSHWDLVRRTALEAANHRCQRCGERHQSLDVHHRTYSNLGCEYPADVVALCRRCHEEVHAAPRSIAEVSLDLAGMVNAVSGMKREAALVPGGVDEPLTEQDIDIVLMLNRRRFEPPY
jgi:hypothetical protein